MKVIQVSSYFYPAVGGVERQAEEIAFHLAKRGHQVKVLATKSNHAEQPLQSANQESYRGFHIKRFRSWLKLGDFLQFAPQLVWHVLRAKYDVIHVHNIHDGHLLPIIFINIFKPGKLIVTGHNPFVVGEQKRGRLINWGVKIYDLVLRFLSSGVDKYIALLSQEKQVVTQKLGIPAEKIAVVPNGIQDIYYQEVGQGDRFYNEWQINTDDWALVVGTASRLNYVKGLQNLHVAVTQLPDILFILAGGDDGYQEYLHSLYADNANVIFTDRYLSSKEMLDFYAATDLFLLPSVYEPFGMTIVEAMAQGCPVLATSAGGPPTIVPQQAGKIIDPDDEQGWASSIEEYVDNLKVLNDQSEAAKEAAEKYRWPTVIEKLIKEYKSLF